MSDNKKVDKALVVDQVARHMVTGRVYPVANSEFPEKFIIHEPQPGKALIYRIIGENKEVQMVSPEYVIKCVIKWCADNWGAYPELLIEPEVATKIFKNWAARVTKVDAIRSFEFADGKNYVTHRIPFTHDPTRQFGLLDIDDKTTQERFPYIEFLSRCSSPKQLNAFIGSIFCDESYLQQYVILWGNGGDGKGTLIRSLGKLLDQAFHVDNFEFMNQFWTSSFIGKRLIVFPDNNNQKVMQSGLFKQLTGGDDIRMEIKNGETFTQKLNAKFLVTSNFAPILKMDKADQRRAIVIHVDPVKGDMSPSYEAGMQEIDQLKFMVDYSIWQYRQMCPDHGPIPTDRVQDRWIENADEELEQKIIARFRFGGGYVTAIDQIRSVLDRDFNSNKVSRLLAERFGCVRFRARATDSDDGKKVRKIYYAGIGVGNWAHAEDLNRASLSEVSGTEAYENAKKMISLDTDLVS